MVEFPGPRPSSPPTHEPPTAPYGMIEPPTLADTAGWNRPLSRESAAVPRWPSKPKPPPRPPLSVSTDSQSEETHESR